MFRALLLLFVATLCSQTGVSQDEGSTRPDRGPLHIPRVSRPPKLSDFLDGVPREAELVITNFVQKQPGDGTPASKPTAAYLSYDDRNLYVGYICKDDKKLIRARLSKREQISKDDRVTLCIDTFHDHRQMYWFDINPYGVQAEGVVIDGVEDTASWDTLWYTDAKITDDGYVVLVTLPFKSIRFPDDEEQTWGLIIGRLIMRYDEHDLWPHVSFRRPGFVQQGGDLEGFRNISPGRNIQFIPYGAFSRSRYLDTSSANAPQFQTKNDLRAGLDAKVVLKDAITLDATLNPDFSQVESDEPQVTINQRYEVFFPEKRPFFLENAGYFKTPEQLFFSWRIVDPQFGARFTGKVGKWALGALAVDDRAPGNRVGVDSPLRGKRAGIGVFRLQRDVWRNSAVAGMVTSQDFGSTHNRVYSVDSRLQLLPNWNLNGQAMSSDTRLQDGRQLKGPAYFLEWVHSGRHFMSETRYTDRSPNFRSALGFFDRVDIREVSQLIGYRWRSESGVVQQFGPEVTGSVNYNRQGRLRDWTIKPVFEMQMTRITRIAFGRWEAYELFNNRGYRWYENVARASSEPKRWLALEAKFGKGKNINYYPGPGLDPFLARMLRASAGFTLRPNPHLQIGETYLYSGLKSDEDSSLPGDSGGTPIFNNHILRSKVSYQFDTRASLRVIVEYNSVLPNHTLVSLEKAKHIGADILFTYMLNPGTALHVGYTDLYDNWRLDPLLSPELYRTNFPGLNTGRQLFIKLSYLFRF